ncbi:MAG: leucine-rich repeat domain-containing protein [Clostridia bacterium]|nr:leucine-rich repeat domain-containing protein [Clostridia bacterium]
MKKKIFIALMSVVMAFSALAFSGCENKSTEPESLKPFTYKHFLNRVTITGVKDKSIKDVFVPSFVTNIEKGAFEGCNNIENVTIPFVGESSVEPNASNIYPFGHIFGTTDFSDAVACFQNYIYTNNKGERIESGDTYYLPPNLKSVTITDSKYIHAEAFKNISVIDTINLPNSIEVIGENAFYNSSVANITIPSGVKEIGSNAFYGCTKLEKVTVDNEKDFAQIAFADEKSNPLYFTKKLYKNDAEITDLDLSGVEKISAYAFVNGKGIKTVTVNDSLTEVGEKAFDGCDNINKTNAQSQEGWLKIAFNGFASNPVYHSENLYIDGKILTELVVPSTVTSISPFALRGCKSIISITLHDGVTSIGEYAFYGCVKLFEVNNFSGITLTESAHENGSLGTYALVVNTTQVESMFSEENGFITANTTYGKTLIGYNGNGGSIIVPADIDAVCDYAMYPNTEIKSVTFQHTPARVGINTLPKSFA